MLEDCTYNTFIGHVGEIFKIRFDEGNNCDAELLEAVESKYDMPEKLTKNLKRKRGFSLIFRCPEGIPANQGTRKVSHKEIGDLDIFLVPVGYDNDTKDLLLQAVFN